MDKTSYDILKKENEILEKEDLIISLMQHLMRHIRLLILFLILIKIYELRN